MSNKSEREQPAKVYGRVSGEPEWSALNNGALTPGVSINGAPPLVAAGDVRTKLLHVRCYCGTVVAEVWLHDSTARTGRPPFWSVVGQVARDRDARPVVMRHFEDLLRPGETLICDCPAHGRHTIDSDRLLTEGRRGQEAYVKGRNKVRVLNLARVSR